jgi:glutamate-ammonia-ligase adenylyltransferase
MKTVTQLGPFGRLYEMDARLRPTGKSGALACSLPELAKYFAEGQGQLWERQALCKARMIYGSDAARGAAMNVVREAILRPAWRPEDADEIRHMRLRLEQTAARRNLKRGVGGTVDIEFLTQMLQLKHAAEAPSVIVPGTFDALAELRKRGFVSEGDYEFLTESYAFLRSVESRLRLMNTTGRHDLPESPEELSKLAYLLGNSGPHELLEMCAKYMGENRRRFERVCAETGTGAAATIGGG